PEAEREAKEVAADAAYDVAKVRCEPAKGKAKDRCLQEAKAGREAVLRQAKVEKVQSLSAQKERLEEKRKGAAPAAPSTPEAKFASARAYCVMQGEERDRCLADVKKRFGKS